MNTLRWILCATFSVAALFGAVLAIFPEIRGPKFSNDDLTAAVIFALLALVVKPNG